MPTTEFSRAALIIRGLSGEHLHGYLPGRDNRAAISRAAGAHGWNSTGGVWGEVTRAGIGEWRGYVAFRARRPQDAVLFITWPEVLDVIRRGCADGYREKYEAACREWLTAASEADKVNRARKERGPGRDGYVWADPAAMHEAKAALIRHGCEEAAHVLVQGALF